MLFTEPRFLVFFLLVFLVHWTLPRASWRKHWLLLGSYVFYGAWDWRFLFLILGSSLLDFLCGLKMADPHRPKRRQWLILSLSGNLGVLLVFKYFNFFLDSLTAVLTALGLNPHVPTLSILLPVGISFFTFQTMSYTIEVYRGRLPPIRRFGDFALFVAFFPQLVAGPIVRAHQFLPQLAAPRSFSQVRVRQCCLLFLIGFVKKACLADQLAPLVDTVFADPASQGTATAWLGLTLYAIQIYGDFSGYSDMAIAAAGLLGYQLPLNFNFPYLSASVTEFWRRWHISLSSWFRDYLYIPLGGNRGSRLQNYRNLILVFLLCGLWHGANWTFVIWGLFHGTFLVIERLLGLSRHRHPWPGVSHLYTLLVVTLAWVFFRSPDLVTAREYLAVLFSPTIRTATDTSVHALWWSVAAGFALTHVTLRRWPLFETTQRLPDWLFAIGLGVIVALALLWVSLDYTPFIYFQF